MHVYPSVLLQIGDLVENPNGNCIWYVTDIIEGIPILCDGTNIFCPRWGFYFQQDYGAFVPILE